MSAPVGFCQLLRASLKNSGVSQRVFSEKCGFSQALVQALLSGRSNPSGDKIDRMIQVLGLSGSDASTFRHAAALAHVPNELASALNESNAEAVGLRLSLARLHAEKDGMRVDLGLLAKKTGKTTLGLSRAFATGYDHDGELAVVAAVLGVDREWILYGTNDPKWYKESLSGISLPTDQTWEDERKRVRGK